MIAIKDMEMPNDCRVCPFTERIPPGRTRCLLTCRMLAENYNAPLPERNEYCPLVDIKGVMGAKERKGEMMDDTISRREAIKVVRASCHWDYPWASKSPNDIMSDAVNALKGLPSAQSEIIHCNSCKHWTQSTGKMKGYGLGRCDFHDADLVTCNGFCYWAERRNDE